jgi:hypothetical protein
MPMRSRVFLILVLATIGVLLCTSTHLLAGGGRGGGGRGGGGRGGGGRGGGGRGGGGVSRGGGSFSGGGGGGNFSRSNTNFSRGSGNFSNGSNFSRGGGNFAGGGGNFTQTGRSFSGNTSTDLSRGSYGNYGNSSRSFVDSSSPLFSDMGGSSSRPSGGRVPSTPGRGQSSTRPSTGGSATQLPSANQPNRGTGTRPSQLPNRGSIAGEGQPGTRPSQRPGRSDAGNFLGVASAIGSGAALGGAMQSRPSQLPANRFSQGERSTRPEQRPNWNERSQNRDNQWRQRVDNRNDAWNQRSQQRQQRRDDFQKNRDQRWDNLQSSRDDRQNWRDQRRQDWQQHREDLWNYRADRAEEIWDNVQDYYDDIFDDAWWGYYGWGPWWGYYPADPWWWWGSATWSSLESFASVPAEPVYVDYGMNVVYEGDTAYVADQPIPAAPLPSDVANQDTEWIPLGVFALAQEERGDPIMFFQLSMNREGIISGAFQSTAANDIRPVAGQADKTSQRVAWRIGVNTDTIFETTLGNLTQDVSPIAVHFQNWETQTWLLVRMPEPAPAAQPQKLPEAQKSPPPLKSTKT